MTKDIIILMLCIAIGAGIGWAARDWFCPDADSATVEVLKADNKKIEKAEKEVEIKYVYRDKIKTIIQTAPAAECLDNDLPDVISDGLLQSYHLTRPKTD